MGIAWNPGMRDTAIRGLVPLLYREEWRDGEAGPSITDTVSAAVHDTNPLIRMHAAEAVNAMYASRDPHQRANAIGDLLLTEQHAAVRAVLIRHMAANAASAPDAVDAVIERLLNASDSTMPEPGDAMWDGFTELLTYLALVPHTTFSSQIAEYWCQNAPTHAKATQALAQCTRRYLRRSGSTEQQTAFRLLGVAANASLTRWTQDPHEHTAATELSDEQRAELRAAVTVTHEIAGQIYFASGAFDETQGREPVAHTSLATFADLAFPILKACAAIRVPQCIHEAVKTMIFLAPLDESRALQAIAEAVPPSGPYAADSIAGTDIIPYLNRLLTEHRPLVLFDHIGIAAFRHLLATFAAAGNEEALALAYRFADIFR